MKNFSSFLEAVKHRLNMVLIKEAQFVTLPVIFGIFLCNETNSTSRMYISHLVGCGCIGLRFVVNAQKAWVGLWIITDNLRISEAISFWSNQACIFKMV
jgi:hypothetical protein